MTSIGYRGLAVGDLPFDAATGTVPNIEGRVIDPETRTAVAGVYVAGWIKRGPRGFIGTNKTCSQDTVAALVADYNAGLLSGPAIDKPQTATRPQMRRRPRLRALAR